MFMYILLQNKLIEMVKIKITYHTFTFKSMSVHLEFDQYGWI